ncbi:cytochrome B [Neisseria meningitidis]|uniref:cytochrome B n=1 Tax=Neisseria meningitidis TaxID=487 RepID=UPI0009AB59C0|nr:cytochrome B [Neisseria meningitidis]
MNTNQPAVYDPLTRTLHWLTVAGFIGIPTTIVLWTIYSGLTKIRTRNGLTKIRTRRRSRRQ